MDTVAATYRLATDAAFAGQLHTAAYSGGHENMASLLAVIRNDRNWQQLCDPANSEMQLLGWSSPVTRLALRGIQKLWDDANIADDYRTALDAALPRSRAAAEPVPAGHPLLSGLPRFSHAAAGGSRTSIAAVLESWNLLYAALHLLDDLEDGDASGVALRYGNGVAINIATGLLASTNLALAELERDGIDQAAAQRIRTQFNRTLLRLCAGQHGDLTCSRPSLQQCREIGDAKSGAFFALACEVGARAAGADDAVCDAWHEFGRALGRLVQIGDDLSGLWPTEHVGSDLRAGERWTLPVAYAMHVLGAADRIRLAGLLRSAVADPRAEREARQIVVAAGAVLYMAVEAECQRRAAEQVLLAITQPSTVRTALLKLLDDLLPRQASSACPPAASFSSSFLSA